MSALTQALVSFLKPYVPVNTGLIHDGNVTFSTERYTISNNNYRIHIIVESKLEDLDEALQRALDNEDYHQAEKINQIINQRKNESSGEAEGIDRDPDE